MATKRGKELAKNWLRRHGQCHVSFVHWAIEDSEDRVDSLAREFDLERDRGRKEAEDGLREAAERWIAGRKR